MPRKRDNPLGLPERVYHKHGAFYYVHFDGRWERLAACLLGFIMARMAATRLTKSCMNGGK